MDNLEQSLVELKQAEKKKFEELYEISSTTNFFGTEDDVDVYEKYIDTRQTIIDEIDEIENSFNEVLNSAKISEHNEISQITKDIQFLINKIIDIDKKTNEIMLKVSSDISKEIIKTAKRVQVNNKYTTLGNINSVFFDSKN